MLRRFLNFGNIVLILVIGIFLNFIYIGYLAFHSFKTVEFKNEPFPVLNQQPVKPGELLDYQVDYCRYTKTPSQLTRTLVGPTIITIVQDTATSDVGCRKVNVTNTVIPSYTPSGKYYLKINICFQVNPLRNICQQVRTQSFKVE